MDNNPLVQKYGRALEPGEVIFEEDDEGEHMFIIQDGQVQISRTIVGKDTPMAVLEKGEFFGEMALVNRIRRTARAKALTKTILLAFDRVGFEQMIEKNPKIALNIIDKLCRRLNSANAHIRQMTHQTSQRSLSVALSVLAQREEGLGTRHQIEEELGLSLQCSREEVDTVLSDWLARGVLGLQGELVVVRDRALMAKMVEAP